ncbi:hypothetical protein C0991_004180 [Blastosporella zonata]|nr:hypothetical protein C0991_004180 [Blastosporella zonata]
MFSSLASFLPSLHLPNSSNPASPAANKLEPTDNPEEQEAYQQQQPTEDDTSVKKGKTKAVNETFIIVRPPPAKSNHPLNLQVQLVPPAARNTRQSVDDSDGGNSTRTSVSLTRTASNRSDTSTYSSYGSTASFSSTASASSTRRTIIPLYSLQAHNVLTNTIVDAGTDAKIAKFLKRGIEMVDLAVLEPVEVWSEPPKGVPAIRTSRPATPDPATHSTTAESSVTSLHRMSSNLNPNTTSPKTTPISFPPPTTPTGLSGNGSSSKRNLFGKMFKKKDSSVTSPPVSPVPSRFSPSPSTSPLQLAKSLIPDQSTTPTPRSSRGHSRNLSAALSPGNLHDRLRHRSSSPNPRALGLGLLQVPSLEESSSNGNGTGGVNRSSLDVSTPTTPTPNLPNDDGKILRPPVLGIQPTLSYSYSPISGVGPEPVALSSLGKSARALMHVWFVRKWMKRRADNADAGGLLGMMQHSRPGTARGSGFSNGGGNAAAGEGVEVRFEWKRNTAKGKARKVRGRRGGKNVDEAEVGRSEKEKEKERGKGESRDSRRLSLVSHHSLSTNLSVSEDGHDRTRDGERERRDSFAANDGDDSEPEDSETPWTCTLKIRRTGAGTTGPTLTARSRRRMHPGNGGEEGELGVIPGAPQVLKLKVGTLSPTPHHPKVVAMLKVPFPLPDVEVERMTAFKRPTVPGNPRKWEGLTFTAEEIKDVVCSTAMWVVVREGFGGVGKVSRKGDGWRIRA